MDVHNARYPSSKYSLDNVYTSMDDSRMSTMQLAVVVVSRDNPWMYTKSQTVWISINDTYVEIDNHYVYHNFPMAVLDYSQNK